MIILASASPRRRELLTAVGVAFRVAPASLDERQHPGEAPLAYVRRIAREKAETVQRRFAEEALPVLAADTIVALEGEVFGKPADATEATRMLSRLSGRAHRVSTAVVLVRSGQIRSRIVHSQVYFRVLTAEDIARYLATGEAYDKAGGYGIQGAALSFVRRVRGSYTNVVGLPVEETLELLRDA